MKRKLPGTRSQRSINLAIPLVRSEKKLSSPHHSRHGSPIRQSASLKKELDLALKDLAYEKENKQSLNYLISQLQAKISKLQQGHLSVITSEKQDHEQQLSEQLHDREQAEKKLREITVEYEKLEENFLFHKEMQDKDRSDMQVMQSELEKLENRLNKSEQLKKQIGSLTDENQDLLAKLDDVTKNSNMLVDKLEAAENDNSGLRQQLKMLQTQASKEAESRDIEKHGLQLENENLSQDLEDLRNENKGLLRDLKVAHKQIQQQRSVLSENFLTNDTPTAHSAESKYNVIKDENQDLKQNRLDLRSKNKTPEHALQRVQSIIHKENDKFSLPDSFPTPKSGSQTERQLVKSDSDLRDYLPSTPGGFRRVSWEDQN